MGPLLGIDLGTTNSLCGVFDDGPRLLPNALGQRLTPSVVGVLPGGEIVVGDAARELAVAHPERTAARFKRWMGTDRTYELGGRTLAPHELSALVLRCLKADAEAVLGEPVSQAVVTVPAYFNELQREATRAAGRLAGLDVRRLLNEPTAAALHYGRLDPDRERRVLVLDLGGGTFDVTLMDVFEGTLEIVACAGRNRLGGEDFTDRLAGHVLRARDLEPEHVEASDPRRYAVLLHRCELAKRALGEGPAVVAVPGPGGEGNEGEEELTNDLLRALGKDLLDEIGAAVASALRDGRAAAADLDEVLLVGGATRMPLLHERVAEELPGVPVLCEDPDHAVALGAAVQSALIVQDRAVDDLVMTDVCPFTLGVEVFKEIAGRRREGYFAPVLHRNTTIPVSRVESFNTVVPYQGRITLKVYQGEARRVEDNLLLGELDVRGIPRRRELQEVEVRFTYDLNGLLAVDARVSATGKTFSTVFTHHAKGLSEDELQGALKRMQGLKFCARDDQDNVRLGAFAEAVVRGLHPDDRASFEELLDCYEHALGTADRASFDEVRSALLQVLQVLGHPYGEEGRASA